jgi:hypothetical protein
MTSPGGTTDQSSGGRYPPRSGHRGSSRGWSRPETPSPSRRR